MAYTKNQASVRKLIAILDDYDFRYNFRGRQLVEYISKKWEVKQKIKKENYKSSNL